MSNLVRRFEQQQITVVPASPYIFIYLLFISIFVLFTKFHIEQSDLYGKCIENTHPVLRQTRIRSSAGYRIYVYTQKGERVIYPNYRVGTAAAKRTRRGVKLALGALIVREGLLVGDCHWLCVNHPRPFFRARRKLDIQQKTFINSVCVCTRATVYIYIYSYHLIRTRSTINFAVVLCFVYKKKKEKNWYQTRSRNRNLFSPHDR